MRMRKRASEGLLEWGRYAEGEAVFARIDGCRRFFSCLGLCARKSARDQSFVSGDRVSSVACVGICSVSTDCRHAGGAVNCAVGTT